MGFSKLELEKLELNALGLTKSQLEELGLETSRLKFVRSQKTSELIRDIMDSAYNKRSFLFIKCGHIFI